MVYDQYVLVAGRELDGPFELSCALREIRAQYRDLLNLVGVPFEAEIHTWTGAFGLFGCCSAQTGDVELGLFACCSAQTGAVEAQVEVLMSTGADSVVPYACHLTTYKTILVCRWSRPAQGTVGVGHR